MNGIVFLALVAFAAAELPFHPLNAPLMPGSNGRIIGGQDADIANYNWQASMQRFGSHFCGASLVSATTLVSAAHCAVYDNGVTANLGSSEWKNPGQTKKVTSFVQHPQYNGNTYDYDYAVVTIESPVTTGDKVGFIELADAGKEYSPGTQAITTGWGYIVRFPATIPDTLQVATIPLVSAADCQKYWGTGITITDRIQCAAGNGGSTSCMGDSGGPLVVEDSSTNSGYRLIGAVSWGSSTCSNTAPSGYAKISAGRSFLDSLI